MKTATWRRYLFAVVAAATTVLITLVEPATGKRAWSVTSSSLKEMLLVIPPIFVLLGLLDVWVAREKMVGLMGEGSGVRGILLAILLGSAGAGPLYAAFPVVAVFLRKGVKFTNVLVFLGAWSTTKIPMLLFEYSAMGAAFALTRLALSMVGICLITYGVAAFLGKDEVAAIYASAERLDRVGPES